MADIIKTLKAKGFACTGCGACCSICPQGAISMQQDAEGFYIPVVDSAKCNNCMRCEKTCPQLNPKKDRNANPAVYAVRADKETLMKSSSGGAFSILAKYILQKGGYVCGAAFDEDFHGASLIMIPKSKTADNQVWQIGDTEVGNFSFSTPSATISVEEELSKLRGSKYVYAKPKNIYREVKEKLDEGKFVLFSGTPCQTAALRNVLGKDYDNLLTVDILCGGAASEKIFAKYVDEISCGKKIKSMRFRPKECGWSYSGIETIFEDGSKHMIHSVKDPYLRGFLNWLYVGNACASCQFAPPPRQGDFSIGDFWNIDRYADDLKFDDGISCLLVNSAKAEKIFAEIEKDFDFVRQMPLSFLRRFNRLQEKRPAHLARARFFSLTERGFSLEKAVDYALGWKFDAALSGCWTVPNYGGELTYYALYKVLNDLGYTTIMVETWLNIPNYNVPKPTAFKESPYAWYDVCRVHKSLEDQRELNARVKNFVIGSDQVWNFQIMKPENIFSWSFEYAADWRKKISYATSFGTGTKFNGTEEHKQRFQNLIKTYSAVSVRERQAVELLKNEFGIEAEHVLDPVLLCDKKHLDDLQKNSTSVADKKYIFTYFVWPAPSKFGIDEFARKMDCGLVNTLGFDKEVIKTANTFPQHWRYDYIENCHLENWLYYLAHSSFVLIDSFHGLCLAIIYKIPFLFIRGTMAEDSGFDRISSLLGMLHLEDRVVGNVQEIFQDFDRYTKPIDWEAVHEILAKEKARCLNWLKAALDSPPKII